LAHRRLASRAVEQALIHAPRQSVNEHPGTAGFRHRIAVRVEQARAPEAVRLLERKDFSRHVLEQLLEARTFGTVHRQVLEHADDSRDYPAVATAPENFRPVCLALVEERAVAEKEVVVGAVKIIRRAPP